MKSTLDDPRTYKQIDTLDIYDSLSKIGRQFESGWHDAQFVNLGFEPEKIKNIVFAGMGGSNLPAKVVQSLAPFLLTVPFEIVANYRLPIYADKNTLVILCSYSGNTEEILSCAQDAHKRGCKTTVITTGGKLKDYAITEHLPLVALDEKFNSCRVPRTGLGLTIGALIGLLIRLNQGAYRHFDTKEIAHTIERVIDMVNIYKPSSDNPAKSLAQKHRGQGLLLFSANHLSGVGQTTVNYVNETAKSFCQSFDLPDLNHHLLEGLAFPTALKDNLNVIILNSSLYPDIIQQRIQITKDILLKQKYRVTVIKPETTDPVLQVFESLVFLIMFSYYLGIANKVNPGTNPWVDYFKKELR
jgi:glucose/mannose-6-phosphate isomerase